MQTVFVFLMLASLAAGGGLFWVELEAHFGHQAAGVLLATVAVLTLGGWALRLAAIGQEVAALRRACLAVAAFLTLVAVVQWPGVHESRLREALLTADMTNHIARTGRATPAWRAKTEWALEVASVQYEAERSLREHDAHRYRYARGGVALGLAAVWVAAAAGAATVHSSITRS